MSVKIGRNDPCWCKSGRKYKACHQAFDEKIAAIAAQGHIVPTHDIIKNADQIAGIKESCKINIAVLDYIQEHIHEGMNTAEIDKIVYDMTTSMGGIPAPLHYQGYPFSVCSSRFRTVIYPILPECSASATSARRRNASWMSRRSVWKKVSRR